jgi:hypothetical protein
MRSTVMSGFVPASTPALGMVAAAFVLSACPLAGRWQVP